MDENIKLGLKYLKETDFTKIDDGKHVLSDKLYVNLQTYRTKQDADYEAHREYVDIQYIISGAEKIGVEDYNNCDSKIPYNKEKDIEFLSGKGIFYELNVGEFMILYPEDAHEPSISINPEIPQTVRKAVVKVKI